MRVEMRHHLTHARSLARANAHSHTTSSSSSSLLPHPRRYDDSLGCFYHAAHSNELQAYSETNSCDSPSITHDRLGSRKHERHGSWPWSYAPHSAQQVHESACSLGPLPIMMSSLAAARYSSSTTLLFERLYQADGTRARRTCASCSRTCSLVNARSSKICYHTHNDARQPCSTAS